MSNPTSSVPPPRLGDDAGASGEPSGDQPTQSSTSGTTRPSSSRDNDEVERLLADARVRVQQTLDESMAKAEELLAQRWATVRERLLAEVHGALADLARLLEGMAEVQERLVQIEALLQEHDPAEEALAESLPTGRRLASVPPLPARPDRPTINVVPTKTEETPASPTQGGPGHSTISLPRTGGAEPALATTPQSNPAEPESTAQTEAGPDVASAPDSEAFDPGDGAVTLRVDPVAGFQELMRIQDVLGRIDGIGQVTVEAYEQGVARLRLDLASPTRPKEIATGLGQRAEVRAASTVERTLRIALTAS